MPAARSICKLAPSGTGVLNLLDERIPVLDPSTIIQKAAERRVTVAVERGIQWLGVNFPPPDQFLPENDGRRAGYVAAKKELETNGSLWRAQLKSGSQYGLQAQEQAYKNILKCLSAFDLYYGQLADRYPKLSEKRDELYPIWNQIDEYRGALYTLAHELESKVELAALLPGGYYFAVELFGLSQFVRGVSARVGSLTNFIAVRDSEYLHAIEAINKKRDELDALDDEWSESVGDFVPSDN